MRAALWAGLGYFALVFAAGFVLGVVRVLFVAPATGAAAAVLAETPLMLALAWFVAGRLAARLAVPARFGPRLVMGGLGFALLLAAEAALGAALGSGEAPVASLAGRIGLAAQAVFGLIPALRLAVRRR